MSDPDLFVFLASCVGGLGLVLAFFVWCYLDKLTPGFLGARFRTAPSSASESALRHDIAYKGGGPGMNRPSGVPSAVTHAMLFGAPIEGLPAGSPGGVGMALTHDEIIMEVAGQSSWQDAWAPTRILELEPRVDMPQPGDDPALWGIGGFHGDSSGQAGTRPSEPEPRTSWARLLEDED